MKLNSTLSFYRNMIMSAGLVIITASLISCKVVENGPETEQKYNKLSQRERDVKIYPDMIKKMMHVKNTKESSLDFFVFDLEGTLMIHYKMEEGDHKKITGLEKGSYTYQVFKKDEMSEAGKLIIK